MKTVICPHCKQEHSVVIKTSVPDNQKMSMTITFESPYIAADAVGKTLWRITQVLQSVAKNVGGKVGVFLEGMDIKEGEITAHLLIASVKNK
jgi:hypothetical protein